eukprot:14795520-Alexandrium_andersonii.AAC.1
MMPANALASATALNDSVWGFARERRAAPRCADCLRERRLREGRCNAEAAARLQRASDPAGRQLQAHRA